MKHLFKTKVLYKAGKGQQDSWSMFIKLLDHYLLTSIENYMFIERFVCPQVSLHLIYILLVHLSSLS